MNITILIEYVIKIDLGIRQRVDRRLRHSKQKKSTLMTLKVPILMSLPPKTSACVVTG